MMIKPAGMNDRDTIHAMINDRGFEIIRAQKKILSPREVWYMYDHVFLETFRHSKFKGEEFFSKYMKYMTTLESELLIVGNFGEIDFYKEAINLRGHHYKGFACSKDTIRGRFLGEDFLNSFHASKNDEEAKKHIKLFY